MASFSPFPLIDQLILQGVEHFCIAPGAQSIPLVKIVADHPKATTKVHFDERGIGFYALGIGKATQKPAVIITTSGSAVVNLLPSIVEAHYSKTPMILLTADRPPKLKECSSHQTMDQLRPLFPYLRFQFDLPFEEEEGFFRSIAAQSYFHSMQNPKGVCQINCQIDDRSYLPTKTKEGFPIEMPLPKIETTPQKVKSSKGLISIGAIDEPIEPILELAQRLQWPIIADLLSNARSKSFPQEIRHFERIIENHPELKPEFHLHFGERFISKIPLKWPADCHVSPDPFLQDPTRSLKQQIRSHIEPFCKSFQAEKADSSWLNEWKRIDQIYQEEKEMVFKSFTPTHKAQEENQFFYHLSQKISHPFYYFFGTSMPIRLADRHFFPKKSLGYFANRGMCGIDGIIATIAGIAEGKKEAVIAVIGDQTALHDLNSLALLQKSNYPITLIIINNQGGRIFSRLPLKKWDQMEHFVEAEHKITFAHAAALFSIPYLKLDESDFSFSSIIEIASSKEDSLQLETLLLQKSNQKSLNQNLILQP